MESARFKKPSGNTAREEKRALPLNSSRPLQIAPHQDLIGLMGDLIKSMNPPHDFDDQPPNNKRDWLGTAQRAGMFWK